jgi:hypothetical protein
MGGIPRIVDSLLARLASVGLTVLAPSPDAWDTDVGRPGIVDCRFADDDGVDVPRPFGLPGDLPANDEDLACSGVNVAADKCP